MNTSEKAVWRRQVRSYPAADRARLSRLHARYEKAVLGGSLTEMHRANAAFQSALRKARHGAWHAAVVRGARRRRGSRRALHRRMR